MTERAIFYTTCRDLSGSLLRLFLYLDWHQATRKDCLLVRGKGGNDHD